MQVNNSAEKPAEHKNKEGSGRLLKTVMVIFLALILVTFLMPSAGVFVSGTTQVDFGSYDGVPITYSQSNFFGNQVAQLSKDVSGQDQMDQAAIQVYSEAFQRAALNTGLEREATLAGVMVTNQRVLGQVVKDPRFLDEEGIFSLEEYKQTPSSEMLQLSKNLRQSILVQQYQMDLIGLGRPSDKDAEYVAQLQYPQRKIGFITYKNTDYPDSEVKAYGEKNTKLFRTINLGRISVATEGEAQKVVDDLAKGQQPFESLAQSISTDSYKAQSGALGEKMAFELQGGFENLADFEALFTLTKGGYSSKVKTSFGWSVFKLIDTPTEADLSKPETLAKVREYIQRNDAGMISDWLKAKAGTMAQGAAKGLKAAAASEKLTYTESDFFPVNFGGLEYLTTLDKAAKDSALSNLQDSEEFFKSAFTLAKGQVSKALSAGSSVIVFEVLDEKLQADKEDPQLKSMVGQYALYSRSNELSRMILQSPKFVDTFEQGFQRRSQMQFGDF